MDEQFKTILLSGLGFFLVYYFKEVAANIKEAVKSVQELNSKVAVVIERTETHGHEIQSLRDRQSELHADVAQIKAHIEK